VIEAPHKWTAETPYLYTLVLRLKIDGRVVEEFKNTVGFRQVEVQGSRIVVNGVPIGIRGVVTTRANPNDAGESREKIFAREIRLLKEANINTIRSHTTPLEEDFLNLCDSAGIYVMPDIPYVWVPESDFRYLTDGVLARARDVFEQHKNHPSVILWHVGN
jgi:beta-galactosidase